MRNFFKSSFLTSSTEVPFCKKASFAVSDGSQVPLSKRTAFALCVISSSPCSALLSLLLSSFSPFPSSQQGGPLMSCGPAHSQDKDMSTVTESFGEGPREGFWDNTSKRF